MQAHKKKQFKKYGRRADFDTITIAADINQVKEGGGHKMKTMKSDDIQKEMKKNHLSDLKRKSSLRSVKYLEPSSNDSDDDLEELSNSNDVILNMMSKNKKLVDKVLGTQKPRQQKRV